MRLRVTVPKRNVMDIQTDSLTEGGGGIPYLGDIIYHPGPSAWWEIMKLLGVITRTKYTNRKNTPKHFSKGKINMTEPKGIISIICHNSFGYSLKNPCGLQTEI